MKPVTRSVALPSGELLQRHVRATVQGQAKPGDHTVQTRSSGHLIFHHDKYVNNLSEIQIELVAYLHTLFLSTKFQ